MNNKPQDEHSEREAFFTLSEQELEAKLQSMLGYVMFPASGRLIRHPLIRIMVDRFKEVKDEQKRSST